MSSIPRAFQTNIRNLAFGPLRSACFAATACLSSACLAPPLPWAPADVQLLAPKDSATVARETGRRDAYLLQRGASANSVAPFIGAAAVPLALLAGRSRARWLAPVVLTGPAAGGALLAYRATRQPTPAPPDSMRARYGLTNDLLWRSYAEGFREEIEDRRNVDFERKTRGAILATFVVGATFAVFRR